MKSCYISCKYNPNPRAIWKISQRFNEQPKCDSFCSREDGVHQVMRQHFNFLFPLLVDLEGRDMQLFLNNWSNPVEVEACIKRQNVKREILWTLLPDVDTCVLCWRFWSPQSPKLQLKRNRLISEVIAELLYRVQWSLLTNMHNPMQIWWEEVYTQQLFLFRRTLTLDNGLSRSMTSSEWNSQTLLRA